METYCLLSQVCTGCFYLTWDLLSLVLERWISLCSTVTLLYFLSGGGLLVRFEIDFCKLLPHCAFCVAFVQKMLVNFLLHLPLWPVLGHLRSFVSHLYAKHHLPLPDCPPSQTFIITCVWYTASVKVQMILTPGCKALNYWIWCFGSCFSCASSEADVVNVLI